jgi:hypothetical protein
MKRALIFAFALLLSVCIIPLRVNATVGETWVVLVGGYGTAANWYQYIYDTYYAYVALQEYYNIDPNNITDHIKYLIYDGSLEIEYHMTDNETTTQNVRWTIRDWLSNVSDEDDTVFIYFACHGNGAVDSTDLLVDEWTPTNAGFTHVNAEPWLSDDDETNYISLPANADYLGYQDEYYTFGYLSGNHAGFDSLKCQVKLKTRLVNGADGHADLVSIRTWIWNGTWQSLGTQNITSTEWTTISYDASSVLNTREKINNAKLIIEFCDVIGGGADKGSFYITHAYLHIDPVLAGGRIDPDGDEGLEDYNSTTCEWFGVDECLVLTESGDLYWDDDFADDLDNVSYGQLVVMCQACRSGDLTCYSGGFIDDLSAPNRIIITSSNETSPSYGDCDDDGFSEFSEVFFDALYEYNTTFSGGGITKENSVDADFDYDGQVSILEAWQYAYENDYARWTVRTENGTIFPDPLDDREAGLGYEIDECPWMDDNGDGLPTFKAGCDIFLLGDFNFDGIVDATDHDLFLCVYGSGEYHPLYDLDDVWGIDGWRIDGWDLAIIWHCCEKRFLFVSAAFGGTTDPAPDTCCYFLNQYVNVTAIPDSSHYFTYWLLDGAINYENPITVLMDSNHTLRAHWSTGQGGDPCPTLFVWNGSDYVDYGVIDIHNPAGEDVMREVPVQAGDVGVSSYKARFRLREGWLGLNFSESVIDQVKLFAVDNYGNSYLCPLISARHSRLGGVLLYLLLSDDHKAQLLLLETVDLTFIMPYPNIQSYTFIIEGCNMYKA